MTKTLYWLIAVTAIVAPMLHLTSDVLEWSNGGFSQVQLLINYAGFLPMPFLMIGLYAAQYPKIGWLGLTGASLYGIAFIYFIHTTFLSLEESFPNYKMLWHRLGAIYTFHGGLMVIGGLLFGFASLKAGVLWRKGIVLFIVGIFLNLIITFLPLPEIVQIIGSSIRNLGLMSIGFGMIRTLRTREKSPFDSSES